jgi:hypothetical protein
VGSPRTLEGRPSHTDWMAIHWPPTPHTGPKASPTGRTQAYGANRLAAPTPTGLPPTSPTGGLRDGGRGFSRAKRAKSLLPALTRPPLGPPYPFSAPTYTD